VAQAASATTAEDTPLKGSVTATDADGDALTFALVTGPSHGTLSLGANGAYTYTPAANYNGADSFSFRASDGTLTSPAATVTLNVTPVNDAPTAGNDAGAAPEDGARVFTWAELFANDADVDANDPLTIVSVQAGRGSVTLDAAARTVTYHADHDDFDFLANGATTADSFTYTLRDQGGLTATGTVVMTVTGIADAATQSGSTKSDVLSGGAGEDSIDAGNGADSVTGGPGADTLGGGTGEDQLAGGDGRDSLAGAQGQDTLLGGAGTDTLQGDEGDDRLDGGAGSDRLTGGVGDDSFVFGGAAPRPGEVDVVTDFRKGEDHIVLTDGVTLTSTTLTDATGDGAADTVLLLSNGVTVVLAGYTGSLAGYIV
jgi:VCBS repeat-containing protein